MNSFNVNKEEFTLLQYYVEKSKVKVQVAQLIENEHKILIDDDNAEMLPGIVGDGCMYEGPNKEYKVVRKGL